MQAYDKGVESNSKGISGIIRKTKNSALNFGTQLEYERLVAIHEK